MISTAHLLAGLSLAFIAEKRIATASIFALIPDFDITFNFLYPFVHRGIMHSLLAAILASFLVYVYSEDRVSAESCFVGYSSHLFLDMLTSSGIPLLFPFFSSFSLGLASAYSIWWNSAIMGLSVAIMFLKKNPGLLPKPQLFGTSA